VALQYDLVHPSPTRMATLPELFIKNGMLHMPYSTAQDIWSRHTSQNRLAIFKSIIIRYLRAPWSSLGIRICSGLRSWKQPNWPSHDKRGDYQCCWRCSHRVPERYLDCIRSIHWLSDDGGNIHLGLGEMGCVGVVYGHSYGRGCTGCNCIGRWGDYSWSHSYWWYFEDSAVDYR
jgi:hypothetical protein